MKTVLLLVTWFVNGQAPVSYQSEFNTGENCLAAAKALYAEAARLRSEKRKLSDQYDAYMIQRGLQILTPAVITDPTVSAICSYK